ncbi:20118_t:CDS:2 [Entrophospora sp. SA101]|nr:20118_t:CDS:2 [Entrophospora sp. SA101]
MTKTRELTDFERGAIYGLWKGKRHTIREIAEALEIPKSTISDNITS